MAWSKSFPNRRREHRSIRASSVPLWVTQAVLPILREQGSGHLIQVSSMGGVVGLPNRSIYSASKWAFERLSEVLAAEVASFGVNVTLVEPGGFATGFEVLSKHSVVLSACEACHQTADEIYRSYPSLDPKAWAAARMKVVDAERPPLRVFFGAPPLKAVKAAYEARLKEWAEWQPVSIQPRDVRWPR